LHEAAMEQMRVKTLTKITNKELAEEFSTLTDLILKVFKDYFYLEYHCTDEVARIIEESDKKYEVERIKREVEELGHLKLAIRQIWNKVLYPPNVLAKYADEIAQRFSLGESVSHYRYKELIRMLMGEKVSIPDRSCVVWGKFSNGEDIVGSKAESIIRQLQKVDASSAEFKGSIGNKGYYKGRVKKIEFSAKTDFKKEIEAMNAGDVLVSGSTGPEMILACKKAGAIITDEGGIISHAAIVSRELNIPSVIGTKVATRILKDGDLVEVDADKGVVRLLDQNQQTNLVKKYSLNASTWTYKGFHGVLHTFFPVGQTGGAMQNFFGDSSKITIFFVENDYVHWYWNDNELTRIREEFFEKLKTDSKYLAKLQKEWQSKIANFETITSSIDSTDLTRLSDEELAGLYDRFFAAYVEQFSYFMVLGDAISMHADRYLVPEFEKVLGADFSAIFPELISTKHLSFIEEEAAGRKKLVGIFKESGTISDELLKEHAHKYFYIQNNYARATRLDENDFLAFIKEDVGKPLPEKLISEKKKTDKEKLIKQYHLSDWHKTLIYVMDEFFEIQDTRKKYVLISNYYQFNFLKEAERRSGIPFNLLRYSIYPEYRAILNKTVSTDQLFKRSEVCMCVHEGLNYQILSGEPARTTLKFFQDKGVGESKKELKGLIASKGIARGKVKIILKIHDMINMEKGDILVSSMTRPEMTPAMKLAAAIVTDEGGVTSHAAIVSRELGIPCIIGTKQATHILKDGDLVEVDADSGIVRIIS
ncbi:MAG: PEP-utilizing enzyme, partial [bacterium]|nr:PEP-utilizing enzyme [bacterium]